MPKIDTNSPPLINEAFCEMVDRVTAISERKYITVILGILIFEGPKYFGQLKKEIGCISAKTLSHRLNILEKHAIIFRTVLRQGKVVKVLYTLTDLGRKYFPIMKALKEWGDEIFKK